MRQGQRTSGYPADAPALPDRFRGAPALSPEKCPDGCQKCAEACPTDAITHGHGFELATYDINSLIYRKEQLLAAKPAHLGANPVFNTAEVAGGAPAEAAPGE
jgi:formate hydrogenlyase subunit 6/NADH:ubiquinone oxidoreductase subunit I